MADVQSMHDLILAELQYTYAAEQQVEKAIPDILDRVSSPELRADFEMMQATAKRQQQRLAQVFALFDWDARAESPKVVDCLLDNVSSVAKWKTEGYVHDAALISHAQIYVHYLLANYGSLRAHCRAAGMTEAVTILTECLEDEAQVDEALSDRAEAQINVGAMSEPTLTR